MSATPAAVAAAPAAGRQLATCAATAAGSCPVVVAGSQFDLDGIDAEKESRLEELAAREAQIKEELSKLKSSLE